MPEHLGPVIAAGESAALDMTLTKAILAMIEEIEASKQELSLQNLEELHELHMAKIKTEA
ncbi:hypothetical protein ACI7RC_14345 [Brevibacillus sp. B_LB10_24]|uniref:hypothetical protein n=1 Tax=Brevibacillus sp. B_LB10_24 TaxID=3380645 RepID=UPI0038BB1E47